jgi:alkaline phosphatase D
VGPATWQDDGMDHGTERGPARSAELLTGSSPRGLTRRTFLSAVVASAIAAACSSDDADESGRSERGGTTTSPPTNPTTTLPVPDLPGDPFTLGVASGDPLPDAVILWTRLAPDPLAGGGMPDTDVPVSWELAMDDTFTDIVASGTTVARPALAHAVHVDATDLTPDTWYHYRFTVGDHQSPTGRTRTAPAPDADVEQLRFAFASCQHWEDGYWTAYPHLVEEENLDLVVFLGDYIYEGDAAEGRVRQHNSDEVVDLAGYRNRYALYKGDDGLQAAHARVPWVVTWDDHEVDNNYAALTPEDGAPVGPETFGDRRAAAYQAWYEHHPARIDPPAADGSLEIHRSFRWGSLADLIALDTRQYRTDQGCGDEVANLAPACDDIDTEGRTMLGPEQRDWLLDQLTDSPTTWRILANQVVLGSVMVGEAVINYDQWDGYPAERREILQHLVDEEIDNVVIVTGDIHFSACGNLRVDQQDPTSPIVASEFVGTSMGSQFDPALEPALDGLADLFEDILYINGRQRGYVVCTVTPGQWRTDYRVVETTAEPTSPVATDASFVITAGSPGASAATI